jgi:hypothetical protein
LTKLYAWYLSTFFDEKVEHLMNKIAIRDKAPKAGVLIFFNLKPVASLITEVDRQYTSGIVLSAYIPVNQ